MTVSSTSAWAGPYTGNGVTVAFPFTFSAGSTDEVEVLVDGELQAGGVTVELNAGGNGGTVTFDAAPEADDGDILIRSAPDFGQDVALINNGPFLPTAIEGALDQGARRDTYLRERVDKLFPADANSAESRAGYFNGWDADGNPARLSGTGSDAALRTDLAADNSLVGYRSRSVKMKLDDWAVPADRGADPDGATSASGYISAILAEGKHLVVPKGHDYLVATSQGLIISEDGQIIDIAGSLTHDGTDNSLPGDLHGYMAILRAAEGVERIRFTGGGTINGARGEFTFDNALKGSAILLFRNPGVVFEGIRIEECMENGIYALNCPEMDVQPDCYFYRTRNCGIEFKSYAAHPLTGDPWTGEAYHPSGKIYGTFEAIDDNEKLARNGVGVLIAGESGAPRVRLLRVGGRYLDCLAGIQSENNYVGAEHDGLHLDWPEIIGNIRGPTGDDGIMCLAGVNLISVCNVTGGVKVRNQGNVAPLPDSNSVGLGVITCDQVDLQVDIETDTGIANRMQYGVRLRADCSNVKIEGKIEGMALAPTKLHNLDAAIPDPVQPSHIQIIVRGGTADQSWAHATPYEFRLDNIAGTAADVAMLAGGVTGMEDFQLPAPGRIVAAVWRQNADRVSGNITIKVFAYDAEADTPAYVEQTNLTITQADIGTGQRAPKSQSTSDATQVAVDQNIKATVTTSSFVPAGSADARLILFVDHTVKR